MRSYIWDTGPLSLYFAGHQKSTTIMNQCLKSEVIGYVPLIILSEFHYLQWRHHGERISKMRVDSVLNSTLIISKLEERHIFGIGQYKVRYNQLSLADAALSILSKDHNSTILTTETEIPRIKELKSIKIKF
ncbi:MAG: hypothetical protein IH840_05555 [Candidatus Heimdallarchaeota archaeon]|nr:hypothetical protein [Candidatus Heimdallarchaeota archaeon]